MPAMPEKGMAAMRMLVTLSDRGNGVYEGSGQLDSGGNWQVMILAKKNGQVVASKLRAPASLNDLIIELGVYLLAICEARLRAAERRDLYRHERPLRHSELARISACATGEIPRRSSSG